MEVGLKANITSNATGKEQGCATNSEIICHLATVLKTTEFDQKRVMQVKVLGKEIQTIR